MIIRTIADVESAMLAGAIHQVRHVEEDRMGDVFLWEFFLLEVDASVNVQRDAVCGRGFFLPSFTHQHGSYHVSGIVIFDQVVEVPEMPFVIRVVCNSGCCDDKFSR